MGRNDEQELGLLADSASEDDQELIKVASDARSCWTRRTKLLVGGVLVTLGGFIIVIAALLYFFQPGKANPTDSKPIESPSDYIISQAWDYDAGPFRREFYWTITDAEHNPDGVYRPMMLINNQFPGPLIEINDGDTIVVHVDNKAKNATSIHWHGLYQNGTNWMDGTIGITQCAIASGSSFTYEFLVSGQYGTYWYHAHQGIQASDGLVGPLIVHSREERDLEELDYSTDRVVMVSDHYHTLSSDLLMQYLASDNENAEPVPDGAIINGRAIRDCSKCSSRRCDNTTSNVGVPRFNLNADQNHRLRFINVGAFAEFQIAIDEHNFAIVEVDGTSVKPSYYNRFVINSAQRYSIILRTNVTSSDRFWLRAKMLATCFADPPKNLEPEVWAVVTYGNGDSTQQQLPTSHEWDPLIQSTCRDLNTTDLVPSKAIRAPDKADMTLSLRANFEIGAWRLSRGFFNQSSWRPDLQSPTLMRAMDGLATQNPAFGSLHGQAPGAFINDAGFDTERELVVQTSGIQVLDIVVTNFDDGNHPLHLHGYKYFVLGQGHGYPPKDFTAFVDLSNPLRRDTASVEAYGWLYIRLVADNPGAWAFHCHISWHTEAGLLMQFLTRTELLSGSEIPKKNRDLCSVPLDELKRGAGPEDKVFYGSGIGS